MSVEEVPLFTKLKTVFPLLCDDFKKEGIVIDGTGDLVDATIGKKVVKRRLTGDINSYLFFTKMETEEIISSIWETQDEYININWYWGYNGYANYNADDYKVLRDAIAWVFKEIGIGIVDRKTDVERLETTINCDKINELYNLYMKEDDKESIKIDEVEDNTRINEFEQGINRLFPILNQTNTN
jgi:hypothetical protein